MQILLCRIEICIRMKTLEGLLKEAKVQAKRIYVIIIRMYGINACLSL